MDLAKLLSDFTDALNQGTHHLYYNAYRHDAEVIRLFDRVVEMRAWLMARCSDSA